MSVDFKNKSIIIDGIPTYIFSGEIQSFRLPYDQWKDRLEKMKAMGLNTIGTYFVWNFHSQAPNQADFTTPQISEKMEFNISDPKHIAESGLWRMEEIGQESGWKKIKPFDGVSDCLTETGYYQYRTDFEVTGKIPATIEFTGITGIEAEFFLNDCKLGVFPDKRPNAYHNIEDFNVSFNVEGIIKKGINKIAIACNLIGRHNLGRHIYTGINRPVVLYDRKDELGILHWKESKREAIPTDMEQLRNVPQQALVCFDDSEWARVDVSRQRNFPSEEFTNWHNVQWYRTKCKIPETMSGKPLFLKLPRVAEAWIYVEGQLVGMINEHHSTMIDISAFSNKDEINIAIALYVIQIGSDLVP